MENGIDKVSEDGSPDKKISGAVLIIGIPGFAVSLLIYILKLDDVVGMTIDDGWYVLLAKSLAEGHGYTVINSPGPGILPLYPPGFPFLLSLFYRLSPSFPENVWLLKSVSIAAMIGTGWLVYIYLQKYRGLKPLYALGIAVATMISPSLSFLATSTVMSECVFTLALVSTVLVIERAVRAGRENSGRMLIRVLAGAALASFAFLTRSIAVGLIGAVFIYLVKEKLVRQAVIFAVLTALFCGPWLVYSSVNAPTAEQQLEQGGHIVQSYAMQFRQRVASDRYSGTITAGELPSRVWNNLLEIAGRDALRIVAEVIFENLRDPIKEAQKLFSQQATDRTTDIILPSLVLSLLIFVGFISELRRKVTLAEITITLIIVITVLWPWETIRFMLPLTPFVLLYLFMGVGSSISLLRGKAESEVARMIPATLIILMVGINLYGNYTYLAKKMSGSPLERPQWLQSFDDSVKLMNWVDRSVPGNETLATLNPPMLHLYTGRKTVAWEQPDERWALWKKLGVRYLVWFHVYPVPAEPEQSNYEVIYRSAGINNYRVIDLGPVESRLQWGETVPGR